MIESSSKTSPAPVPDAEPFIYCQQNLWYFRTDRGDEIGPFRYRCEAETGLDHFLAEQQRER